MKNALIIQHNEYETSGYIQEFLLKNNYNIKIAHIYKMNLKEEEKYNWLLGSSKFSKNEYLQNVNSKSLIVCMGGEQDAYNDKKYPYLKKEKQIIALALKNNYKVIGICLGAQLIANVLGCRVYKNKYKEIGWFDVKSVNNKKTEILKNVPEKFKCFHFHSDTFDLNNKMPRIFTNNACLNQGFVYKNNAIGLQFHIEMNKKIIKNVLDNFYKYEGKDQFIQKKTHILKKIKVRQTKKILYNLLDNFLMGENNE